jgi:sodium-dependent dicarboxylate transporter 2/3/5
MFMSNTAAVAVLLPIALAVTEPIDHGGYRRAAVLAIAFAATIGGVGSAIGTPANPLAIEFLETYVGREITFLAWFAYGLPMVVLFLPVMGVWVWRRSKVDVDREAFAAAREVAADQLARAGKLTREQWVVLGVFLAVFAVWLTETWHDLSTGVVAVGGAAALAILGRIEQRDLQRISWASLLTFGGGLTLGVFLVESGASDWIAARLTGLSGLAPLLGTFVVALITLVMTTAASNTASAAMLIPLAIPLSGIIGVDPVFLVLIVAVASSIDFALVIGTPPTMMAYSTGLYTSRQIFRTGIVLDFIGLALLVGVVAQLWSALGLV